jgi:hypothetical protein
MHIKIVAVEALRPYERIARTHSREQIRQIAKRMERFGFNNAVLLSPAMAAWRPQSCSALGRYAG